MATFIGFSTIDQYKKFTLVDYDLIKRDFLNALSIQQGSMPGRPDYGTTLWSYVFEPQMPGTQQAILTELQRVAGGDPRLYILDAVTYPQDNGMLIELSVQVVNSSTVELLSVMFDEETRRASYI